MSAQLQRAGDTTVTQSSFLLTLNIRIEGKTLEGLGSDGNNIVKAFHELDFVFFRDIKSKRQSGDLTLMPVRKL